MSNKNYARGRAKEYRIKKELEARGYIVLRSAGSFGFADLIAIKKEAALIRFIQCKPDDFSKKEEEKLMEEHSLYNSPWIVWASKFEII